MYKRPQFYIIAGPNGAGKSSNGHLYVSAGTPVFNGDLVFAELVRRYPHIEPERLGGGVAVELEKQRDLAIAASRDFGFETNYSNQMAIDISQLFEDAGYELNLVYFGLPAFDNAAMRVKTRVQLGGHTIPPAMIEFNFTEGIRLVNEHLQLYDRIQFVSTTGRAFAEVVASYEKESKQLFISEEPAEWFNVSFRDVLTDLVEKQEKQLKMGNFKPSKQKRRGRKL